ncbi:MAG: undecaprenyl-diphosphate phosphatase [Actinobacteria bacterium]|nr:undecaprenyl-diphosphate phosphatase [Actinomycetota bacterium]
MSGSLSTLDSVILGVVEGITEYLPVSSTGHLLVVQRWLGLGDSVGRDAADTYAIAIQIGAILAVFLVYRARIASMIKGVAGRDDEGRRVLGLLVTSFVPAAVVGAVFGDVIKDELFSPGPVVIAWVVGGVFLILWKPRRDGASLSQLTMAHAVIIGCAQTLALWPGVSRSLVTITAAAMVGLSLSAALEYSFLLGLATLSAATVFDLAKNGGQLLDDFGLARPLLGGATAFVTAMLAVRWLVAYLAERPLAHFGWYRLVAAAVTLALWPTLS